MPFEQFILEKNIPCPRCNADSQKRVEEKDNILIIVHICPMCRYRKSLGVTTRKALKLEAKKKKYIELLNKTRKIEENYKILARIKKIEELIIKEQLGIRS
jgi:hypothetical protein